MQVTKIDFLLGTETPHVLTREADVEVCRPGFALGLGDHSGRPINTRNGPSSTCHQECERAGTASQIDHGTWRDPKRAKRGAQAGEDQTCVVFSVGLLPAVVDRGQR